MNILTRLKRALKLFCVKMSNDITEADMKDKRTIIEVEIETSLSYDKIRELIKKICEDHEGKRDLRIKIKFV